jgi:hypothetical protein
MERILGREGHEIMLANRMVMAVAGSGLLIPIGLIIPFNTASLPAGWDRFALADDKHIIGAGSTYAVGATGGAASLAISVNTSDDGGHYSTVPFNTAIAPGSVTSIVPYFTAEYAYGGAHHHVLSGNYLSMYQKLVLGKATASQDIFPADAIILGKTSSDPLGGLTNVYNSTSRGLMSASAIADGGGAVTSPATSAVTGAHRHGGTQLTNLGGGSTGYYCTSSGLNHNHPISPAITVAEHYKRYYLSAWSKTSAFAGATGMIAMWEGTIAPAGWKLCDGSGGSIDLRNFFIMISTAAAAGTSESPGSNYLAVACTLPVDSWLHTHKGGTLADANLATGYHGPDNINHQHSYGGNLAHTPPYYALTFVEKI